MKSAIASLCLIIFATSVAAQEAAVAKTLPSAAEARKKADQIMAFVNQEKFAEAYEVLKPFWPLPAVEIDGLANQMNTQWPMVQQRYGKSLATEFISE